MIQSLVFRKMLIAEFVKLSVVPTWFFIIFRCILALVSEESPLLVTTIGETFSILVGGWRSVLRFCCISASSSDVKQLSNLPR